jgi:PAS domain-containing protein
MIQARLRLALEAAQMGLWDWDIVTGELVWDERSAAMYGTTVSESSGSIDDVSARVHPDDLANVQGSSARRSKLPARSMWSSGWCGPTGRCIGCTGGARRWSTRPAPWCG